MTGTTLNLQGSLPLVPLAESLSLAKRLLQITKELYAPDGHLQKFDSLELPERIRQGYSTKSYFLHQASLHHMNLVVNDTQYTSDLGAANGREAVEKLKNQNILGTLRTSHSIDRNRTQLNELRIAPVLQRIHHSLKLLEDDLDLVSQDFLHILTPTNYGGASSYPVEGMKTGGDWNDRYASLTKNHIRTHYNELNNHLKLLNVTTIASEHNKTLSFDKILNTIKNPKFHVNLQQDLSFNNLSIEMKLYEAHQRELGNYSFDPFLENISKDNQSAASNTTDSSDQGGNQLPIGRNRRQFVAGILGGLALNYAFTAVKDYFFPPSPEQQNAAQIENLSKTVVLFQHDFSKVEAQMGSLYERIALHESCLFLDNIEQHATTAIQELSLIRSSLQAKVHHLRDIVISLAQRKVPVSLISSEHARRVIKLALEEMSKRGYILSAHDNRILYSSQANLISLKSTLVYHIKIPIQKADARRIQIYKLQKKSALSGRLHARIMYGFDTLLYDEQRDTFLNVHQSQLQSCTVFTDTYSHLSYSTNEREAIYLCHGTQSFVLDPIDTTVFQNYSLFSAHNPENCLVNILKGDAQLALKSCLVHVEVPQLESVERIDEETYSFVSDHPLRRSRKCVSEDSGSETDNFDASEEIQLTLRKGCVISTPYHYLSRPARLPFPAYNLPSKSMSLDFHVIKDLLNADQQLGNISFSQFAEQIQKFQNEFFGQQATFISDFKRIKTFLGEQERVPHNSRIIQTISVYLSYSLCLMFLVLSCTYVARRVVANRQTIHTTLLDLLCYPYDKMQSWMCPSRPRQRRNIVKEDAPSRKRNRDAIASVGQQLIELREKQVETDLNVKKTNSIANSAKNDVVKLLSRTPPATT